MKSLLVQVWNGGATWKCLPEKKMCRVIWNCFGVRVFVMLYWCKFFQDNKFLPWKFQRCKYFLRRCTSVGGLVVYKLVNVMKNSLQKGYGQPSRGKRPKSCMAWCFAFIYWWILETNRMYRLRIVTKGVLECFFSPFMCMHSKQKMRSAKRCKR